MASAATTALSCSTISGAPSSPAASWNPDRISLLWEVQYGSRRMRVKGCKCLPGDLAAKETVRLGRLGGCVIHNLWSRTRTRKQGGSGWHQARIIFSLAPSPFKRSPEMRCEHSNYCNKDAQAPILNCRNRICNLHCDAPTPEEARQQRKVARDREQRDFMESPLTHNIRGAHHPSLATAADRENNNERKWRSNQPVHVSPALPSITLLPRYNTLIVASYHPYYYRPDLRALLASAERLR